MPRSNVFALRNRTNAFDICCDRTNRVGSVERQVAGKRIIEMELGRVVRDQGFFTRPYGNSISAGASLDIG
jgi:hypothetical protein